MATRYEKSARNFLGMVLFIAVAIRLKSCNPTLLLD